jgi:hypothetical protein
MNMNTLKFFLLLGLVLVHGMKLPFNGYRLASVRKIQRGFQSDASAVARLSPLLLTFF